MVTALMFLVAMFLSPVAQLVPGCATAAALIYVGVLMMNCVKDIKWLDATEAVPACPDAGDYALCVQHFLWHLLGRCPMW